MTKTRSVLMACGLTGVLGLGALTIGRAQQAEPKVEKDVSGKQALRERLITLRTEVEILQIEHDADRADLIESVTNLRTYLRRIPSDDERFGRAKLLKEMADEYREKSDEEKRSWLRMFSRMASSQPELAKKNLGLTALDEESLAKLLTPEGLEKAMKKEKAEDAADETRLRQTIDQKRKNFAHQTRELNEKKLDLEDLEKRYSQIR